MNNTNFNYSVTLRVISDTVKVIDFFDEHKITVSTFWNKGDEIITPSNFHTGKYKSGFGITIESGLSGNNNLEEQVESILDKITSCKDSLRLFLSNKEISCIFSFDSNEELDGDHIGLFLNSDILYEISDLHASIDIDFFV